MTAHNDLHNHLLTLPKADFPSLGHDSNKNNGENPSNNESLLLLTLPSSLEIKDLSSSEFILSEDEGCRLINESKGMTFDMLRVESSNSYVMFPPQAKKAKLKNDEDKSKIPGRLLRENNTFFMECKKQLISRLEKMVYEHLNENFVYPPSKGITIAKLSEEFKYSQKEVEQILQKIHAFEISNVSHEKKYGLLSEEVEKDVLDAIISVLSEWDEGMDYANTGVLMDKMIRIIHTKEPKMEESIIRHCLVPCIVQDSLNDESSQMVKLDASYIAKMIAHQLFNSQVEPWEQSQFVSEWHRLMPGVGKHYEPDVELLKGIAIEVTDVSPLVQKQTSRETTNDEEQNVIYLKYFPKKSLPTLDDDKFAVLFKEKIKWKLDDMKSYFNDDNFQSLLLKYARRFENDGHLWCEAK